MQGTTSVAGARIGIHESALAWVRALRWAVIAVLAGSLPVSAYLLGLEVAWPWAILALATLVASSLRGDRYGLLFGVALDIVAIAGVLAASGGAANPFSSILLVYVALAASLLALKWTLAIAGLAALTFGGLFLVPGPTTPCGHPIASTFSNHLYGMWIAFVLGACLVAVFVTRVRHSIEQRDRELADLRAQAERADKFAALGTLAAGTAHELGTPLGTIHVLAGEIAARAGQPDLTHSAEQIATQVERCKAILDRMRPGRATEPPHEAELSSSVIDAVAAWRAAHPSAHVEVEAAPVTVPLSSTDLEAALTVLLDNAQAATEEAHASEPIVVRAGRESGVSFVAVEDAGTGVAREAIGRVGEPFFTTRPPGRGMGLGLFVVRSLIEQIGGRLEVRERAPRGTQVRLWLGAVEAR